MTRRRAFGLLLVAALIGGGQLVRHLLLVDGAGRWRDPLWLDSLLPALPEEGTAAGPAPRAEGGAPGGDAGPPSGRGVGPAATTAPATLAAGGDGESEEGGGGRLESGAPVAAGHELGGTAVAGAGPDARFAKTGAATPGAPRAAEGVSGPVPTGARRAGPKPSLTAPLNINTCPVDSLELLPGVGPALAARIAAERDAHGPFAGPTDLQRVKGIGPRLAARLAPCLRFATPASPLRKAASPPTPRQSAE